MRPTEEQMAALAMFRAGGDMVIEAGAGTGKTSTLRLLAASSLRRGRYFAFNKAIVEDVKATMSERVEARTIHSVAMGAVGHRFRHRLGSDRMPGWRIAQALSVHARTFRLEGGVKTLDEGFLGGLTMRAVTTFCQTADEKPSRRHVPYVPGLDMPADDGSRTYENNNLLAAELEPFVERAWADVSSESGELPFRHDHYLKLWQLSHPQLEADFVMLDEAQDCNPVMADVIVRQERPQVVCVGDSAQAIYEWMGSVNAMEGYAGEQRSCLSQSFRFGPAIADEANLLLEELDAPLRLRGLDTLDSTVGELGEGQQPDAILCRTNARAMRAVLQKQSQGLVAVLVGGGSELLGFAKGAAALQEGGTTGHPDLSWASSWKEVVEYVDRDPQGDELRLLVGLVEEFGVATIVQALDAMPRESAADVIVSTAHKAKGREWPVVQIADDFTDRELSPPELRLRYVATTRARVHLDNTALLLPEEDDEPTLEEALDDG